MRFLWIETSDHVAPLVCDYTILITNYFCKAMIHARFIHCELTHNIYMFKHSYDICGHTHTIPRRIHTIRKLCCFVVVMCGSICLIFSTESRHWGSQAIAQHYVCGSLLRLCLTIGITLPCVCNMEEKSNSAIFFLPCCGICYSYE